MNIQTVADNLRNTIAGKEILYGKLLDKVIAEELPNDWVGAQLVKINIDELKRILLDVEQCRPEWTPSNCPYAEAETCHRID